MNQILKSMTLRWPMALILAGLSMLLLPALTHSILAHPPEYDELLHILAARSIQETGIPSIADGVYSRAELYTRLVAWVTGFSDNELVVARLPALFFGMLTTALLTAWASLRIGWVAAIAAAIVFVIAPSTINASVLVRFYTLHTFLMAMVLLYWYEASSWQVSSLNSVALLVSSAVLIWFGLQFHELTKITVLSGISALAALLLFDRRERLIRIANRRPIVFLLAVVFLIVCIIAVATITDAISLLRGTLPIWSENRANNFAFYISALSVELPLIWPLFIIMVVFAYHENPRVLVFCLTAFVVSLMINSIAAQKATRYFHHAYPLLCILWATGFQRLFMFAVSELRKRRSLSVGTSLIAGFLLVSLTLLNSHEVKRGVKLVLARGQLDDSIPVKYEPDWALSLPRIGELAQTVDTLIVSSGVKGLYTFGKYDYELGTTVVQETDTGLDFGTDPRTNRRVIGLPTSVNKVIDAEGRELFVLEDRMVNKVYSAPVESVSVLNQRCKSIDLTDTGSQISAWIC